MFDVLGCRTTQNYGIAGGLVRHVHLADFLSGADLWIPLATIEKEYQLVRSAAAGQDSDHAAIAYADTFA